MRSLKVYDTNLNRVLQPKRMAACFGCVLAIISCLFVGIDQKPVVIELSFAKITVTSALIILSLILAMWFYCSYLINLQNDRHLNADECFEISFYASLDTDIEEFISRIKSDEGRDPVLHEYAQIIGFAHNKSLPIYHNEAIN